MSNQLTESKASEFRQLAGKIANSLLRDWVGEERAGEATGRISAALAAAAASAKNPADFYACTPQSIGQCIAIAALTSIMPGVGSTALAYLIPRRPRKNEQPQLNFWFSHRGLAALAARGGTALISVAVSTGDKITIRGGEVSVLDQDPDDPPMEWDELRGVMVVVKRLENGLIVHRGWVSKRVLERRRDASDTYQWAEKQDKDWAKETSPWHRWPVEMAMKAAMHYAISRGWCVIDDTAATKALSVEQMQDVRAIEPPLLPASSGKSKSERMADALAPEPASDGDGEPDADWLEFAREFDRAHRDDDADRCGALLEQYRESFERSERHGKDFRDMESLHEGMRAF